jgi:hypothetical protein
MIIDGWRGPSWRVVDADPRYSGQIRDWIRSAITRHDCPIVVCDGGGPGQPRLRESGGLAEGGRGLQVVNALAARWDCFLLARTQVVWCDFGQPLRAAPGDAWAWLRLVLAACDLSPSARPAAAIAPGALTGVAR